MYLTTTVCCQILGAAHIEEVRFVLGFPPSFGLGGHIDIPQEEIDLSAKMMEYWNRVTVLLHTIAKVWVLDYQCAL